MAALIHFDMSRFVQSIGGPLNREQLVTMAKTAENAERYDDMCLFMRQVVLECATPSKEDLTFEERNLLSVAYKNVIGARRASWRTLQMDDSKVNEEAFSKCLNEYKKQVETELEGICKDVLDLLENHLLVVCKDKKDESEVFYFKMTADYYRYLAEFKPSSSSGDEVYAESARKNYDAALNIAKDSLPPTHPIYLGLALNYSVCFYEILKMPSKACELAKLAFDNAIKELDALDESSYKDSTLIMQLLRDNLTLWSQTEESTGTETNE